MTVAATVAPNWWDEFVAAAKAELEKVKEVAVEIYDAVEPVVVAEFNAGISELEQIALGSLLKNGIAVLSGQEKLDAAVVDIAYTVQTQGKAVIMADVQQAAANGADALSVAKAKLLAS